MTCSSGSPSSISHRPSPSSVCYRGAARRSRLAWPFRRFHPGSSRSWTSLTTPPVQTWTSLSLRRQPIQRWLPRTRPIPTATFSIFKAKIVAFVMIDLRTTT
ncbi:hypothetical protein PV04_04484 [Phialophora macrospora]|uniref:Uncharacterized protein n=1 Tax=Phialophora macrospora TaxID=1851006 RepID=A0A0D2FPR6_9EURO|nr:hypothetical protein PV04_04484 [Phialophora macrospora]